MLIMVTLFGQILRLGFLGYRLPGSHNTTGALKDSINAPPHRAAGVGRRRKTEDLVC